MFLAPFLACFLVFLVLPVVGTIWWSTRAGSIFGGTKFIGFRNFVELPGVVGAWSSIENTLLFALYSVPAILVGALAVALVLARVGAARRSTAFSSIFRCWCRVSSRR